jgi:hypothetical protein
VSGKFGDEELPGFGEEPPWEMVGMPGFVGPTTTAAGFIPLEPPIPEHPMEEEEEEREEEIREAKERRAKMRGVIMEEKEEEEREVEEEAVWEHKKPTTKGIRNRVTVSQTFLVLHVLLIF